MEELTYDDLLHLYTASTITCDNCETNCDKCSFKKILNKTKDILEKNGYDISML